MGATANATTPTSQLNWIAAERKYIGEISDTNGIDRNGRITLVGKTGREVVFVLTATHRDGEGDITHWTFRPEAYTPCQDVTLILFND